MEKIMDNLLKSINKTTPEELNALIIPPSYWGYPEEKVAKLLDDSVNEIKKYAQLVKQYPNNLRIVFGLATDIFYFHPLFSVFQFLHPLGDPGQDGHQIAGDDLLTGRTSLGRDGGDLGNGGTAPLPGLLDHVGQIGRIGVGTQDQVVSPNRHVDVGRDLAQEGDHLLGLQAAGSAHLGVHRFGGQGGQFFSIVLNGPASHFHAGHLAGRHLLQLDADVRCR